MERKVIVRWALTSFAGGIVGIGLGFAFMSQFTAMPGDGQEHGLLGWILIVPLGAFWLLSLFPFAMLAGMLELPETPATFAGVFALTGALWTCIITNVARGNRTRNANHRLLASWQGSQPDLRRWP